MKIRSRIPLLLILLVAPFGTTKASKPFQPELSIGITGGYNLSQMRFSPPSIRQNLHHSYNGGITLRGQTEKYFGLQLDILFDQTGWVENNESAPQNHYARTLDLITVPLYAHANYPFSRIFKAYLNVGPYISFLLNETVDANYRDQKNPLHTIESQNPFIYGIAGGIGFEFTSKIGTFDLGATYRFGLGDIFFNTKKDPIRASAPMGAQINLAYRFRVL